MRIPGFLTEFVLLMGILEAFTEGFLIGTDGDEGLRIQTEGDLADGSDLILAAGAHYHLSGSAGIGTLGLNDRGATTHFAIDCIGDGFAIAADDGDHLTRLPAHQHSINDLRGGKGGDDTHQQGVDAAIKQTAQHDDGAIGDHRDLRDAAMGEEFVQAEDEEITAAGRGTAHINEGQTQSHKDTGKETAQQGIAFIQWNVRKDNIQKEGGNHHRFNGLDEKELAHNPIAQQDDGDVDAQDRSTDGDLLEKVMDNNRQTGHAAGSKIGANGKGVNAYGIQNTADDVKEQVGPKVFFQIRAQFLFECLHSDPSFVNENTHSV